MSVGKFSLEIPQKRATMMMFSPQMMPATAAPAAATAAPIRSLRRRREDDMEFNAHGRFNSCGAYSSYLQSSSQQPNKKIRTNGPDTVGLTFGQPQSFQAPQSAPFATQVTSDYSLATKKLKRWVPDQQNYDQGRAPVQSPPQTQWYDLSDVSSPESDEMDVSADIDMMEEPDDNEQYLGPRIFETQVVQYGPKPSTSHSSFSTLSMADAARTYQNHNQMMSTRIDGVLNDEPCNALVIYRPPPPASSWKVEPESEDEREFSDEVDDSMEIY
ncbi:hypothetical protein AC1031_015246 [Aphanomyces cochlioides]|nr:hypothetical protein AC1031_015246 [Aphanomyces cochlioides]